MFPCNSIWLVYHVPGLPPTPRGGCLSQLLQDLALQREIQREVETARLKPNVPVLRKKAILLFLTAHSHNLSSLTEITMRL